MSDTAARPAENKMGIMPVGKLLITMSLPMIISMLVQAAYNIVDSYFVAQLSEAALTAVSLAFPVQNLMIAIATGTGVGINALLSKSLGEKNFDIANHAASNSIFLALCSYLVFALFGGLFSHYFFRVQTDNPAIIEMGTSYLLVCTLLSFGIFMEITMERLLQSTGKSIYSMVSQLVGAITNIILDPIMIFGLLGFPAMGVTGAALATVIGQILACCLGMYFNIRFNHDIHINFKKFRPDRWVIGRIYAVGVPSIIMGSIGSVMTFGINKILISFTETATAVFGIYFKLQSFVFMPVFGLNNGMVPIISYNFGARKPERIKKTVRLAITYAVGMMVAGMLVFWLFPSQLFSIFNASANMLAIGVPALRIISISFLFAGFSIVTLSFCQSLGHGMLGLSVSVVRQLVVLLPTAYILSRVGGLSAVWWAYPFAELFSLVMCAFFLRHIYRREVIPLASPASSEN